MTEASVTLMEGQAQTAIANLDAEFKTLHDRLYEAWSTADGDINLDAAGRFYVEGDDLIVFDVVPPLAGFHGWASWRANMERVFYTPALSSLKLTANDDLHVRRDGDTVWSALTFHLSARYKDGREVETDGRQTNVWERRGSGWLAVHEHASMPMQSDGTASSQGARESSNIAIIRAWYDTMRRGDLPALNAFLAPSVEFHQAEGLPQGGVYIGGQTFLEKLTPVVGQHFERFETNVAELLDAGDDVVSRGNYRGRVRATGRDFDASFTHIWTLGGGKVVRFRQYTNTAEFLRAFGDEVARELGEQTRPFRVAVR